MLRFISTTASAGIIALAAALSLGVPERSSADADDCLIGIIDTVAGGEIGDGRSATEAAVYWPAGVALGPDGSLYVAEEGGHRIRKVGPDGIITTVAGTGETDYSSRDGAATEVSLWSPRSVMVAPDGTVYLAEKGSHRIRKVDRAGRITTVAGTGEAAYAGDNGPATQAALHNPCSIALARDGSLYIADTGNDRIRKVDGGGIITTVAGGGTHPDALGDGGPAIEARLNKPLGVAVGPDGSIIIADSDDHRIRKVDAAGIITTAAGSGEKGYAGDGRPAADASLNWPCGVAVGPDGSIYVADTGNHRIRKIDAAGTITTVAGDGKRGYSGDGGPALDAGLSWPAGLTIGADGSLYIADTHSNRIRRVDAAGSITTVAGGTGLDDLPATEASLFWPSGVAVGTDGTLYIGDMYNQRVRRVDRDGLLTTLAGTGESGYSGDGGPARDATLDWPEGIALAPDGSLYIADGTNHRIRRMDPAGIITTAAGNGEKGYSGDGGPATEGSVQWPCGVAVAAEGSIYIADTDNHRIRKVDPAGVVTTVAGNGKGGYSGDGGPAVEAGLHWPNDVAIGADGSLYIADDFNHRIRKVDRAGVITTVAGSEQGYSGDGGPAAEARLNEPTALALGADGSLYIADMSNHRIRKVDPEGTITTVAGTDDPWADLGDGGPATWASLSFPNGVALAPDGTLYIGDQSHQRVRRIRWWPCAEIKARADELRADAGDSLEAWHEVARWYLLVEAWDDAISAAERSAALAPEGDELARLRAEILAARGWIGKRDDHEARQRLIRVLAGADDPLVQCEAVDALVELYIVRGDRSRAASALADLRLRMDDPRLIDWIDRRLAEVAGQGGG